MTFLAVLKGPMGLKTPPAGRDPKRLAAVAAMPCVICYEWGLTQKSPTQAHHCIHVRHSQKRAPDSMTIPLCEGHHIGLMDTSKIALHRHPMAWREEYGDDVNWIGWVEARL